MAKAVGSSYDEATRHWTIVLEADAPPSKEPILFAAGNEALNDESNADAEADIDAVAKALKITIPSL